MSRIINNFKNIIKYPIVKVAEYIGLNHPVTLIKIRYFVRFKRSPDFKNPEDLNEKILYLKLFTDTSRWSELADKYKVRNYVKSLGLGDTLVKLYGVWYKANEFKLDKMPNSFILKANNGDGRGTNTIINDKKTWNETELKQIIDSWLKRKNISALAAEPHYDNIEPCVIAEELLPIADSNKSLIDYKIWCFNGKVHHIWVCTDRDDTGTEVMSYDLNWKAHPEFSVFNENYRRGKIMQKPKNFDSMIEIAEKLSKPFPVVRVDLYNINGKIFFGEMTFTSLGGMMNFYTPEFLLEMGAKVNLNYPNSKY